MPLQYSVVLIALCARAYLRKHMQLKKVPVPVKAGHDGFRKIPAGQSRILMQQLFLWKFHLPEE